MSEQAWQWQTGEPLEEGQYLCRWEDGTRCVRTYRGAGVWWHTTPVPDWWSPIQYPPDPEPEKPLIQRVAEALRVVLPDLANGDWVMLALPTSTDELRDAILWRIQEALAAKGFLPNYGLKPPTDGGILVQVPAPVSMRGLHICEAHETMAGALLAICERLIDAGALGRKGESDE